MTEIEKGSLFTRQIFDHYLPLLGEEFLEAKEAIEFRRDPKYLTDVKTIYYSVLPIKSFEDAFDKAAVSLDIVLTNGKVEFEKRQEIIDRFQELVRLG